MVLGSLTALAFIDLEIAPIFPALISGTMQSVAVHLATNTTGMLMAAGGMVTGIIPRLQRLNLTQV